MIAWLNGGDLENRAIAMATVSCGLGSIWFWYFGKSIINCLSCYFWSGWRKVLTLGLSGAIVIEFVFWLWEKIAGPEVVPFDISYLINFIFVLIGYLIIILIFWQVQKRYKYSTSEILVFGGFYQVGIDVFIEPMFRDNPLWGLVYGLVGLPVFMTVASVIMLPLSQLIKNIRPTTAKTAGKFKRYFLALIPILGLIPLSLIYYIVRLYI